MTKVLAQCGAAPEELAMEQNTLQPMVEVFSSCSETMLRSTRTFWEKQAELLDDMQVFADGWFERRHAGTKAALEASQRMCGASTPLACLGEYQKWMAGALVRVMADGSAFQNEIRESCRRRCSNARAFAHAGAG